MVEVNRAKRTRNTIIYHVVVAVIGIVMIYPILWLGGSSLKPDGEIWTRMSSIIPQNPTLSHYVDGWKGFGNISFSVFYKNTIIISVVTTICLVFSSAFIAYGFARLNFPLKKFWFACMLTTLMLPLQIQLIPQYIMFSKLGWVNSFKPIIVPSFFGRAFFIFMIVQFIRGVPRSLDEAAEIDGCNRYKTFLTIIMPLCSPAMITAAIFAFYWSWGEFLMPLIYLNKPKLYTISLALRSFSDPSGQTDWGAIYAMSFLSLLPVFAIFIALQKYLIEGISTEGLKG